MSGFNVGDRVAVKRENPCLDIGTIGTIIAVNPHNYSVETDKFTDGHDCDGETKSGHGWFMVEDDLSKCVKEEKHMSQSKKNFRNGDVIKVNDPRKGVSVFIKFGENYYNLSENKQMKGYRYLPPGEKTTVANLGGMGEYFLMDEAELSQHLDVGEDDDDTEKGDAHVWVDVTEMPSHDHGGAGSFSAADLEKLFRSATAVTEAPDGTTTTR